ncbi:MULTISPECIES: hypothetical protein [Ralstonia]|uniref:hypothetical protein n=1 Tax=Ralstonia TaxID=48736 RepID=UPI000B0267D1|nr:MULTISPECIES: hypothetical protein [Ralstonia]PLT19474.1 hypothetical protein CXP34_05775 [Ralstonia mannitolilytica]
MGEFAKLVQAGKVSGPLRRTFSLDSWSTAFAAAGAPDETDQRVYDAAVVIHTKLANIRSRLKLSSAAELSAVTKLRAFVAAANYNFLVAREKTREAFKQAAAERAQQAVAGFRPEEFFSKIKLELTGGFQWSPNEVVEGLVDGIEVPVRFALQGEPNLAGNPRLGQVEWSDIILELNLGIMFRHAEDLWEDCLWNGYKVVDTGRVKTFVPQDVDAKRGYALGLVRRFTLGMGYSFMATKVHRSLVEQGFLPRIREVRAIEKEGRRQVIKVSKPGEITRAQEELFILRGFANEPYYAELLEEALPSLNGLTLSAILDAWVVISRAALVLLESVATKEERPVKQDDSLLSWLPEYVPVLQVDALVRALSVAAGIKPADGRKLIEFFTYRGQAGQEIWASPLVPVGLTTVAPIFAAIVSPNLRRLVDVWMRQAGVDLAKRGPAFEAHVRASVQHSIASSNVLAGSAICINDDYTFRPKSGREEQIDLLFVIGSTVFMAEAKCILEPTDSKGMAMHRKTVLGAAGQALRKSRALEGNRAEFVADVARFGIDLPENFDVFPLIVVSTSTHVGVPADGVPVIDEYILEKFLEGELEDVAVTGSSLEIQESVRTVFYTDLGDAEEKAPRYFASPPQVQRLLNGITERVVPLHAIDGQDWEGYVITFECVPSQEGGHQLAAANSEV